jgi:hypothetical protein
LSEVKSSTALSNWASWYCASYRGTDQTSLFLQDLKLNEDIEFTAGFKIFSSPTATSPLTNASSDKLEEDFVYKFVDMGALDSLSTKLTAAAVACCLIYL